MWNQDKKKPPYCTIWRLFTGVIHPNVGATGFEPATPTSRTWCATGLRYAPMCTIWQAASKAIGICFRFTDIRIAKLAILNIISKAKYRVRATFSSYGVSMPYMTGHSERTLRLFGLNVVKRQLLFYFCGIALFSSKWLSSIWNYFYSLSFFWLIAPIPCWLSG